MSQAAIEIEKGITDVLLRLETVTPDLKGSVSTEEMGELGIPGNAFTIISYCYWYQELNGHIQPTRIEVVGSEKHWVREMWNLSQKR